MSYQFIPEDELATLKEVLRKRRSIAPEKRDAYDKAFQKRVSEQLGYKAQFYWAAMIIYQDSPGATIFAVISIGLLIATSIFKAVAQYFF